MIEFKYKEYIKVLPDKKVQVISRPNAEVTISNGSIVRDFDMLVDSGADISLLPKSVGDELGLEIEHEEKIHSIQGLGGKVPVVYRDLIFNISKEKFSCKVGWVLIDGFPPILGREVVFDRFHIEFLQDKEIVRFQNIK